jgi:hypothetical protein
VQERGDHRARGDDPVAGAGSSIEDVDVRTGDVPSTNGSQAVYLCPECETVLGYSQVGPF